MSAGLTAVSRPAAPRAPRARHAVTYVAGRPIVRVVARRILMAFPLLVAVTAMTFVLVSLVPGDPAQEMLGMSPPPGAYERLREQLGLDLPVYEQYFHWARHAVTGDLGTSLFTGESVTQAINGRLPVTLTLISASLTVQLVLGLSLGMLSAVRGGVLGRLLDGLALVGFALPSFWIGAILITIFAVALRWLPATGFVPFTESPGGWARSLVLPVAAISLHGVASLAKQTREALLDVLSSEYVRMAWGNGVSARSIYLRHAVKNAAIRVVTIVGLQAVGLLGGTVVVETVFALPGLGSLAVNASLQRDIPLIQGVVVYVTIIVVLINLTVDLAYTLLNPKLDLS